MKRLLHLLPSAVLLAGLVAVAWVGAGYLAAPLALSMTGLIGAVFIAGAADLVRYRRATTTLERALDTLPDAATAPADWLARLPATLQAPVRMRLEGERAPLPAPSLAPGLAGLLVLLGMLGTFLGMVLTLRGTGQALAGATDLQSVRDTLIAPVRGLGLAFGTSIAGVAASAALGLATSLARHERAAAARALDRRLGDAPAILSPAQHRQARLELLQRQAEWLPALVDRLDARLAAMAEQQTQFHAHSLQAHDALAGQLLQALERGLVEGSRRSAEAVRPALEATLGAVAEHARGLHETLAATTQRELGQLAQHVDGALTRTLEAGTRTLAQSVEAAAGTLERSVEATTGTLRQSVAATTQSLEQTFDTTTRALGQTLDTAARALEQTVDTASRGLDQSLGTATRALEQSLGTATQALDQVREASLAALTSHQAQGEARAQAGAAALDRVAQAFESRAAALVDTLGAQHASAQSAWLDQWQRAADEAQAAGARREAERLADWQSRLEALATSLHAAWQAEGERDRTRHDEARQALERSAQAIATHTEARVAATLAELSRLVDAAAEAPRAAAQVIAELREQLSNSLQHDHALMAERADLLQTVAALLEGLTRAAGEQRAAIDGLVAAAGERLAHSGRELDARAAAQAGQLAGVAAELAGSAAEVASLGEAFGAAVAHFAQANDTLVGQLGRIESALAQSLQRSDEQLAYYVAQAREVVDLSVLSQRQVLDQLQRVAGALDAAGASA